MKTRKQSEYAEKLRDPRWQKMRLQTMQRDNFCCQKCGDNKSTLHVHHRRYISNRDPWEYPADLLVTLCEECHSDETELWPEVLGKFEQLLKDQWFSDEADEIVCSLFRPCENLMAVPHMIYILLQTQNGEPMRQAYWKIIEDRAQKAKERARAATEEADATKDH